MDGQADRGRSPSMGQQQKHINHHPSTSQHFIDSGTLGLDPSVNSSTFSTNSFNTGLPSTGAEQYSFQFPQAVLPSNDFSNQDFQGAYEQRNNISDGQRPQSLNLQQSNHHFTNNFLDVDAPSDFEEYQQDLSGKQDLLMVDPNLPQENQSPHESINPQDLDIMNTMVSPHHSYGHQQHLMAMNARTMPSQSPGAQASYYSPNHSRHVSLDPSSAYGQQQPTDWTGMMGGASFQQHRRAPSEHSDVSSSVAPSPYLAQQDSFEGYDTNPSPGLSPQQDNAQYIDAMGIERFSLSDQVQQVQAQQQQQQQRGMSPARSPYHSPRLAPNNGLGIPESQFVLASNDMGNQYTAGPPQQIFNGQAEQNFSGYPMKHEASDLGQAAQMAPPEIKFELAPPSRQMNFENNRNDNDMDALSPPERGRRGRIRAKSDPSYPSPSPRAVSPISPLESSPQTLITPDVSAMQRNSRSLSPFDGPTIGPQQSASRDVSPASKSSRRSSTSSIPNRDYILELADPSRPSANGADRQGRVQKHPATFQCTLCPKRFTRAYNLRSHLRTHTDERPFVCTVCGKAFARQHDRKRHEGLHSGEKKFVCRGELGAGGVWGCGRRFARADALGRHFRSEAGRVCIKPLLDEEALERQRIYDEQMMQQQQQHQGNIQGIQILQQPQMVMDMNNPGFALPAALLAQYPALQGLQWDQLQSGPADDGELSGRSSFDASSGGEYYDDEEGGGGYVSGPGTGYGGSWAGGVAGGGNDWASDYEGR
ncbi:MAG: hypothetical protein MMC33_008263 [Icmadophila ericetorum]|nr:hypothetical protein [Icmadophila ericetorum]